MEKEPVSRNKGRREFILLFVLYSLTIGGTIWLSARVTNPSVYDRSTVRLEGINIAVRDTARALVFFEKVLNFQPVDPGKTGLLLPDRRKLFLRPSAQTAPTEIVFRVRSGLPRLYDSLQRRVAELPVSPDTPVLSRITERPWGDEFTVTDYDQNRFIYFRPARRSATRLD